MFFIFSPNSQSSVLDTADVELGTDLPPKICIPRSEQISMNNERSNRRPAIDLILFNKDATKLLNELQYLQRQSKLHITHGGLLPST